MREAKRAQQVENLEIDEEEIQFCDRDERGNVQKFAQGGQGSLYKVGIMSPNKINDAMLL